MQSENPTLSNAQANSLFWDSAVDSFYEPLISLPGTADLYAQITQTILSRWEFDPETTVLMDFACGNGALSVTLAPHCKRIVGVDVSRGMVDAYNRRMENLQIGKARALCAELHSDQPELLGDKFDVILCSQSYKHIENNVGITRVLKSFLKPNGALLVVDLIRGSDPMMQVMDDLKSLMTHTMVNLRRPHNMMSHMDGYTEDEMKRILEEAGLIDFTFENAFMKEKDGKKCGLFLAKGVNSS